MDTSSRGWVFSPPFSACWKRSVCLAEGSNWNGQDFFCPQPGVQPVIANSLWAGVEDWRGKPRFAGVQPHNPTAGTEKKTQQAIGADRGRPWYLAILHAVARPNSSSFSEEASKQRWCAELRCDVRRFWIVVVNSWIPSYKGWPWAKPADCRDPLMCVSPPDLSKCIICSSGLCRRSLWRNLETGRWGKSLSSWLLRAEASLGMTVAVLRFPLRRFFRVHGCCSLSVHTTSIALTK